VLGLRGHRVAQADQPFVRLLEGEDGIENAQAHLQHVGHTVGLDQRLERSQTALCCLEAIECDGHCGEFKAPGDGDPGHELPMVYRERRDLNLI